MPTQTAERIERTTGDPVRGGLASAPTIQSDALTPEPRQNSEFEFAQLPEVWRLGPIQVGWFARVGTERGRAAAQKFAELETATREANWDGFGSESIPHGLWKKAKEFYESIDSHVHSLPQFVVSPCGDGTIHLRWDSSSGVTVIFEFGPAELIWTARDPGGIWSEGRCANWSEAAQILRQNFRA